MGGEYTLERAQAKATSGRTQDVRPQNRKKADACSGYVQERATQPRGRTEVRAASATAASTQDQTPRDLAHWDARLAQAAQAFGDGREAAMAAHHKQLAAAPSGNHAYAKHDLRLKELQGLYSAYSDLSLGANEARVMHAATQPLLERAKFSRETMLTALDAQGLAFVTSKKAQIDREGVRSEAATLKNAEESAGLKRTAMSKLRLPPLATAHTRVENALRGARTATGLMRARQHEKAAAGVKDWEGTGLIKAAETVLLKASSMMNPQKFGIDTGISMAAQGLKVLFYNEIQAVEGRRSFHIAQGERDSDKALLEGVGHAFALLESALRELEEATQVADAQRADDHEQRLSGGERLDAAARQRCELGPERELFVPMTDRHARIDYAHIDNEQARAAVQRYIALIADYERTEHLVSYPRHEDDKKLAQGLPKEPIFAALKQWLEETEGSLGAWSQTLGQLIAER